MTASYIIIAIFQLSPWVMAVACTFVGLCCRQRFWLHRNMAPSVCTVDLIDPIWTTYSRFARPHLKDLKYWRPNVEAKCRHARQNVLMTCLANPRSCTSRAPVLLRVYYLWHRVLTEKTARARGRFFYIRWYTWLLLIGLPYFVLILPSVFYFSGILPGLCSC